MLAASQAAVEQKVAYNGPDWCDLCRHEMKDCIEITIGIFTSITVCRACYEAISDVFTPETSEIERRYHDD